MLQFHTTSHPSETLKELYLDELNITTTDLALKLGVTRSHLSNFLNGKVDISPEFAMRLAKAFQTSPTLWLNLQRNYDLWEINNTPTKYQFLDQVQLVMPMREMEARSMFDNKAVYVV
jgi:antitoxin HigA-1